MKRLATIRGCVATALMLGIVVAVAPSAGASTSGQLGVYMRQGLSLKRAQVALATQSGVEAAELPLELEKALGTSFAGVWFEPSTGKFCIGVVSSASQRAAERVVAESGLASMASYVSVRSTRAQLVSTQGEWNLKLAHLGGQQFSTGLLASPNAVFVTLSSSVPEHERALLKREAARSHVNVSITVVPPQVLAVRPNNSQCEFKSAEAYCSKPIAAGVLITTLNTAKPSGPDWCTAGPLAILSNPATLAAGLETFLITAGHCLTGTTTWFTSTHPGKEAKELGSTVTSVNGLPGDYGDILLGPNWLEAGVTPALAQITQYQDNGLREARSVVGEAASVLNTSFCKQGAKSAEQCGIITGENVLVRTESKDSDGLVRTNSCAEPGDSGGPYATLPVGNSVRILGTEVASPTQTCSGLSCNNCTSYYEPIRTSLTALGLALLTTTNQTRHTSGTFRSNVMASLKASADATQVFTVSAGKVECTKETLLSGSTVLNAATVKVSVSYSGCTAFGLSATISPAEYEFNAAGTVSVLKEITIKAPLCEVKVPAAANTNIHTIKYTNNGAGILLEPNEVGFTTEGTGAACNYAKESNGTVSGNSHVSAEGGTVEWA